jgi:hypothetical protein
MAGVTHKGEGNHKPVNGHLSLVICHWSFVLRTSFIVIRSHWCCARHSFTFIVFNDA